MGDMIRGVLMTDPIDLTDDEVVASLSRVTSRERGATASQVALLAELETRDLHRARGYRSLFAYCRGELHLSEHEAYNRVEAARVARRFPVVRPMLAEGLLHLTAVSLLGPHLRDENHLALLGGAVHKSKGEILELLARWFPKQAVKTTIRAAVSTPAERRNARPTPVPAAADQAPARPSAQPASSPVPGAVAGAARPATTRATTAPPVTPVATMRAGRDTDGAPVLTSVSDGGEDGARGSKRRGGIEPLSADDFLLRVTARRRTIDRLRRAQDLLSHAVPSGDVDEILYRALGELIAQAEKARHAVTARPSSTATCGRGVRPESRTIPAAVKRAVWERDGGRCAFVGTTGVRCDGRRFLQYHHRKPWITGGAASVENISLRCSAHNDYEAKVYFAPMRNAMAGAGTRSGTSTPPPESPKRSHSLFSVLQSADGGPSAGRPS